MNVKVYFQHRTYNEQWDFYRTQVYVFLNQFQSKAIPQIFARMCNDMSKLRLLIEHSINFSPLFVPWARHGICPSGTCLRYFWAGIIFSRVEAKNSLI